MWKAAFITLSLLILGLFVVVTPTQAVSAPFDFTLEPQQISHNLKPGQSYTTSFTVTNVSLQDLKLKINTEFEHADWIKLDTDSFDMKDAAVKKVTLTIKVPANAQVGAYFADFNFTEPNLKEQKQGQHEMLALNVFTKSPTSTSEIQDLSVDPLSWSDRIIVNYTLDNPLDVFLIPVGHIQLLDPTGKPVATAVVNKNSDIVKPHGHLDSTVELRLPENPSAGRYTVSMQTLDKQFGLGKTKQVTTVFVPAIILFGLPAILVLGILGWYLLRVKKLNLKKLINSRKPKEYPLPTGGFTPPRHK